MFRAGVLVALITAAATAAAQPVDPITEAIERSKADGEPVVVVINDSSCGGCTFVEPRVSPELELVFLDLADRALGPAIRKRLAQIPSTLLLQSGTITERFASLDGALAAARLRSSAIGRASYAVRMNPHDPAARLSLAAVLVAQHREIEALATLDEFSRGTLNSEVIVRAIDIARTVAPSQVVKRQRELVRSLPGSLAGAEALVELDAEGSTPDADRLYLAGLVVAAQPADALLLPEAALALARRGDVATAQRAIERSTTVDRAMWTAAVQIAGGTTTPQSSYAKVCSVVPAGHEWDCLALSQALKRSDRRFTLYVNPADRAVANNFASRVAQHATACSNRNRGGKLTASLVVERGQVRALAGWGSHCLGEALERTEGPPRLTMQLDIDLYAGAPALAAFHDQPHRRVPALREPPEPREQPPTATREQPDGGSTGYLAAFDREADARTIGIEGRAVIPLSARGWSFALDGGVGAGADALEVAGNIMVGRSSALSHGILGTVSLGSGFSSIGETRAPTVLADVRLRASDTILWLRATHIFEGEDMGFASTHFEAAIGHTFGGTVFAALRFEERDSDPAIGLAIGFAPFGGTY